MAKQGEDVFTPWESLVDIKNDLIELRQTLDLLLRRELIERVNGGYGFQVEVIRRWFAQG
jgi:hypothetical protein